DFGELVRRAPNEAVVEGIAAAFYAGSLESFADSVRNLFVHSDGALRAELLNILVRSVSRETEDVLSNAGLFGADPASRHVLHELASLVSPDAVTIIAADAQRLDPGVMDEVSRLYAPHTAILINLEARTLSAILMHVARICVDLNLAPYNEDESEASRRIAEMSR